MLHIVEEFDPSRTLIDDAERVVAWLESCPVLHVEPGLEPDRFDAFLRVRSGLATDGVRTWPLSVAHYTRVHRLAPPGDLLAVARARGYRPPVFAPGQLGRLRADARAARTRAVPA
jgi:hypothetical protein